jgi:hypothetical protein
MYEGLTLDGAYKSLFRVKKRQDRRRNHRVRARFRIRLRRFPDIVKPMSDIIFMGDEVLMHPKVLASLKNFT